MGEKLHGTQTRAATNPLDLVEKKLHGTQTSQLLVPEGDPGWKKIELQDTQTSSAEALVWTRKKLHGAQTIIAIAIEMCWVRRR